MEDFDIFTNKIEFTKTFLKNTLNKLVYEGPATPNGPNYESGRKVLAEECLVSGDEAGCAFHLSEAAATSIRTMMVYREEQLKVAGDKLQKIIPFLKPVSDLISQYPVSESADSVVSSLTADADDVLKTLAKYQLDEVPFHKQYLKFTHLNNVDNFRKILSELPEEWTVVQLSCPYNPKDTLVPREEFRTDIDRLLLTPLAGDHVAEPFTVTVLANVTKEGEKPLFTELYSLLEENYKTIDNAQQLNNKRLVQNYWARREDVDLRMKSVINVMDKHWLGGWSCLLTGRLADSALRDKLADKVDAALADWGLIRLTKKQKLLIYKLMSCSCVLTSQQTRSCARSILAQHGDVAELRTVLDPCGDCNKQFRFVCELCSNCLSRSFEQSHHMSLSDAVKALDQLASDIRDGHEWTHLRKARRHPVILILDELLDTFPWEMLPILSREPVSRVENVHLLYYLYKTHQPRIKNGHYVTTSSKGRYIINPEKNLDRMEKRMSSFVEYWCGEWSGHVGRPPPPEHFLDYLQNADIFLYCGHGDGCQFASGGGAGGAGVETARGARAVCVLSGCGSVRLHAQPARQPPHAAHRRLHVAGCPSIVGMLWEVTDMEVDKVVTTLLSLCVTSQAKIPWLHVGKANWSQGQLDTSASDVRTPAVCDRELLRAVSRGRGSTGYLMIASSVVVRGLPVLFTTTTQAGQCLTTTHLMRNKTTKTPDDVVPPPKPVQHIPEL